MCEPNIENIGLVKSFYNNANDTTIDDFLTLKETRYAGLVDRLKEQHATQPEDKLLIDEFVNHLIVRTRNIQQTAASSGQVWLDIMYDELLRPENRPHLDKMIIARAREHPDIQRALKRLPSSQREAALMDMLRPALSSSNSPGIVAFIMQLAQGHIDLADAAKSAQLKALGQLDKTLDNRAKMLRDINWSVSVLGTHTFILGDLGPIAKDASEELWKQPVATENLTVICLPISDRHLLIGIRGTKLPSVDVEDINRASVELSTDFFISTQNTHREQNYLSDLASRANWGKEKELKQMAKEFFRDSTK